MKISCSTAGIVDSAHPKQGINDMRKAGFLEVLLDLNKFCSLEDIKPLKKAGEKSKFQPELMRRYAQQFAKVCKSENIQPTAAIFPYLSWDTKRTDLNELLLQIGKDSIAYCEALGCEKLIIRPLFAGLAREEEWELNRAYYLELARTCKGSIRKFFCKINVEIFMDIWFEVSVQMEKLL